MGVTNLAYQKCRAHLSIVVRDDRAHRCKRVCCVSEPALAPNHPNHARKVIKSQPNSRFALPSSGLFGAFLPTSTNPNNLLTIRQLVPIISSRSGVFVGQQHSKEVEDDETDTQPLSNDTSTTRTKIGQVPHLPAQRTMFQVTTVVQSLVVSRATKMVGPQAMRIFTNGTCMIMNAMSLQQLHQSLSRFSDHGLPARFASVGRGPFVGPMIFRPLSLRVEWNSDLCTHAVPFS